ncbi:glycosyltransferase family 4 protein [Flavobacterium sp.]|uniref:glycosyltransferase family 4 protein n=1 Tax=Flavobacterium sp. TaxID=239 RepID=UPI0035B4ABA2
MTKKLLYIGNKLSGQGNTVTSIETLGGFLESEGVIIYYASSKRNKIVRMLDMLLKTVKYSRKVDFVLIDTYSTINFWYALIISQICRFLKVKYIPKLHGGNLPYRLEKSEFFSKLIFNNAYINIAPSKYLYDNFKKKGFENLMYIPNTIELSNYSFEEKKYDFPRLLWVRSFSKIYNPLMALKVFELVKQKYPNATLTMVGPRKDESNEEAIQYSEKNNLNVEFTGKLTKKEWIELSKKTNVFINTTHFDNTPISVIEAMALGLPVVSTNVGGIPYLITHNENGFLVEDSDVDGMANQILKICSNDIKMEEITNSARKLVSNFDWDKVKFLWFKLLNEEHNF